MAYNPIFDGPEKAPTNGKNGTNVVQTPTPPVNPSYGNQGDLGLNPPNGTTTPPTATPVVNNTANARAQAFNANQQNMAQNGNSLAHSAQGVGSDSGANSQKPISQSENGEQQTQGNKANIQVDPSVQTRGNVFVKQPNAPTNNKWLGKNGVSYVKDENVGTENVYGTPYTPDANLRYAPPTPTRNLTYADFRDAMYGPEAEREKRANRQAKIQAVGDALRHIGNLATTIGSDKMGRAIPQQFKTSPAQQTLAEYKAERKERDAMGYQQLMNWQKQKQLEYNNAIKQQEAARKGAETQANLIYRDAQTKKIIQDMGIQAEKYPYEIKKLVADTVKAAADGDKATFEAGMKKIDFEKYPELKALEIQGERLKNAKTGADIAHTRAQTAKVGVETQRAQEDLKNTRRTGSGRYNLQVPKANYKDGNWQVNKDDFLQGAPAVLQQLKGKKDKNGNSVVNDTDMKEIMELINGGDDTSASKAASMIMGKYKDPLVQAFFKRISSEADGEYPSGGGSTYNYKNDAQGKGKKNSGSGGGSSAGSKKVSFN